MKKDFRKKKEQTPSLCLANEWDYGFFYDLLKERPKEANISHKKMPTRKESDRFNASKPYKYDFVAMLDNERIGRVYLSKNNEIGIAVKKEYQSLRKKIIKLLFKITKQKKYYANISPKNKRSQKFFKKLGFKLIQYTYAIQKR